MKTACVILAAGLGTRMNATLPKVLHELSGIPMISHVLRTAEELRPEKIIVVAGKYLELIKARTSTERADFALQREPKGTAHALKSARPFLRNYQGVVLVLNGDCPLVSSATIKEFLRLHRKYRNSLSVLSFPAADPTSYGRILRDSSGKFAEIIEEKDADQAQKSISEVNSGVYALQHDVLPLLDKIRKNRLKGEYYLTDLVSVSVRMGLRTAAYSLGREEEFLGVNTRAELLRAAVLLRSSITDRWSGKGTRFVAPETVFIHPSASIGKDTTVYPNVHIEKNTRVGKGCILYPNVRITDSVIGDRAVLKDSTVIEGSIVMSGAVVGPFAHLRPGTIVGKGAKIGNFVELKKAHIGKNSKASHLSYLGDAEIGSEVNIGAGTITCNYDGLHKHITRIMDGVFIGSDTQLVAPVKVGKGAYVGAGSTITKDVPDYCLAVSRAEQRHIRDWALRKRARMKDQDKTNPKKTGKDKRK